MKSKAQICAFIFAAALSLAACEAEQEPLAAGTKWRDNLIVDESKIFATREDCRNYAAAARAGLNIAEARVVEDEENALLYRAAFRLNGAAVLQHCETRSGGDERYIMATLQR